MQAAILETRSAVGDHDGSPVACRQLCGISMLERQRRTFELAGITRLVAIVDHDDREAIESSVDAAGDLEVRLVAVDGGDAGAALKAAADSLDEAAVILRGDTVLDRRILAEMQECAPGTFLTDRDADGGAAFCGAGVVDATTLTALAEKHGGSDDLWGAIEADEAVATYDVADVPKHVASMKRTFRPYWFRLTHAGNTKAAARILLDSTQKASQDLLAEYVHPPIENFFVVLFAKLGISPLSATILSAMVAALGVYFFYQGDFWLGIACAFATGITDGIDGKLARVTLHFTKLGGWLADVDWIYEIAWFIVIGLVLDAAAGGSTFLVLGIVTVVCTYFIHGFTNLHFWHKMNHSQYDYARFDIGFQLISGRRNIYVPMLFVGLLFSRPDTAFWAIGIWAALSTVITTWRTYYLIWRDGDEVVEGVGASGHQILSKDSWIMKRLGLV